jgi:VWFA-related protein
LVVALAIAMAAVSEEPARTQDSTGGTFAETVEVELVNVEVWVTDRKGKPVRGLTSDDFRVLHDGQPVAISHFAEIHEGVVATVPTVPGEAVPAPAVAPIAPSHLVVYVDELHLQPGSRKRLMRDLTEFLSEGELAAEQVLILRQGENIRIEAPFGSSRSELAEALLRLESPAPSAAATVTDPSRILQAIQNLWGDLGERDRSLRNVVEESPSGGGGIGGGAAAGGSTGALSAGAGCTDFVDQLEPLMEGWIRERHALVSITLSRLWDTAAFLAGLEGVKTLLYLSDGLETAPGKALSSFLTSVCPGERRALALATLAKELTESFENLTRHANANRVTIYPFQGEGMQTSLTASADRRFSDFGPTRSFEAAQRTSDRQGLSSLAKETGGWAVFTQSRYRRELEKLTGDMDSYYSLAYRPPEDGGGAEHQIEVQAKNGALGARHRRSYSEKDTDQWLTERLQGALYLGLVENPLGVRLGAGEARVGEPGSFTVPLHVMVPVDRVTFLPADGGSFATLQLKTLSVDSSSRQMSGEEKSVRVREPEEGSGEWLDLGLELELGAGVQLVAVALRDQATREASFVSTTLQLGSSVEDRDG